MVCHLGETRRSMRHGYTSPTLTDAQSTRDGLSRRVEPCPLSAGRT